MKEAEFAALGWKERYGRLAGAPFGKQPVLAMITTGRTSWTPADCLSAFLEKGAGWDAVEVAVDLTEEIRPNMIEPLAGATLEESELTNGDILCFFRTDLAGDARPVGGDAALAADVAPAAVDGVDVAAGPSGNAATEADGDAGGGSSGSSLTQAATTVAGGEGGAATRSGGTESVADRFYYRYREPKFAYAHLNSTIRLRLFNVEAIHEPPVVMVTHNLIYLGDVGLFVLAETARHRADSGAVSQPPTDLSTIMFYGVRVWRTAVGRFSDLCGRPLSAFLPDNVSRCPCPCLRCFCRGSPDMTRFPPSHPSPLSPAPVNRARRRPVRSDTPSTTMSFTGRLTWAAIWLSWRCWPRTALASATTPWTWNRCHRRW